MRTWDLRYQYDASMVYNSLIFVFQIPSSFQAPSSLAEERQMGEESQRPEKTPVGWRYGLWPRYAITGVIKKWDKPKIHSCSFISALRRNIRKINLDSVISIYPSFLNHGII